MKPGPITVGVEAELSALPMRLVKLQEVVHVDRANTMLAEGWVVVAVVPQGRDRVGSVSQADRIVYVLGLPTPAMVMLDQPADLPNIDRDIFRTGIEGEPLAPQPTTWSRVLGWLGWR